MSSLLQSPPPILSHSSSISLPSYPSSSLTSIIPTNFHTNLHSPNRCRFITSTTIAISKPQRWNHLLRSTPDEVYVIEPPPPPPESSEDPKSELIAPLKLKLLVGMTYRGGTSNPTVSFTNSLLKLEIWSRPYASTQGMTEPHPMLNLYPFHVFFESESLPQSGSKVQSAVSGLNRGLAANKDDLQKADVAAKEIETFGGPVDLSNLDKLQGRWKLIYSSAFSSRTLGGSRPGPPTGRLLPITLGQVFQRIDILSKDFDNIVELQLGTPWPLEPIEVTATLAHKFELIGSSKVKITFEKTTVKTRGNLSQLPPLEIPRIPDALRPPSNTGSGEFEVTYLDADTRITRGDRDELRVFVIS